MRRLRLLALLAATGAALTLSPGAASAQPRPGAAAPGVRELAERVRSLGSSLDVERALIKRLTQGITGRLRRSIAIGPFVGAAVGSSFEPQATLAGVSFGLGLYRLRVPIVPDLEGLVRDRLRAKLAAHVRAHGGVVDAASNLGQIGRDLAEEVYAELRAELAPRTRERPGLSVQAEGIAWLEPGGGQARLGVGYGVGPISIGLGAGLTIDPGAGEDRKVGMVFSTELGLRLTPIGRARTPLFDLHARAEVAVVNREATPAIVVGTRVLLDVF